ncbi:Protein CBG04412 [Caenorhabditis briggsae]|uniref:Protein CBG04412 n=1 Tax=Caenorhabditis briggsae TaxID=6238 RepID=A8WXH1_CAEBR|nr:Protein CBG04412 [Caenorhabditis briggsae]CAP25116.2 Protein CBG04412 [Caenorhabditis briggsae]
MLKTSVLLACLALTVSHFKTSICTFVASKKCFLTPFLSLPVMKLYRSIQALGVTLASAQNYFKVLIREIDNPAGTLLDGQPCGEFGFLGVGCNVYLRAAVSATGKNVSSNDTLALSGPINSHMETRISNLNLVVSDDQASTAESFSSFDLHIALATDSNFTKFIDDYVIHISTNQEQGVYTYTNLRPGTLSTTVSIAWSTNIAPPSTTSTPEPTTTGVPFTGSTLPPTTSKTFLSNFIIIELFQLQSHQSIVPKLSIRHPEFKPSIQMVLIQSVRGTIGQNITFDYPHVSNYSTSFGTPEKGNNYWFGLENMYLISGVKNYTLQIDLCCGTKLIAKQIYHKFQVGAAANNYALSAKADIAGVGLDYSSSGKDLAAKFSTYTDWNGPKSKDSCDQFEFWDDNKDIGPSNAYGGWWYGSCGNNLNGFLYPSNAGNCTLDLTKFDANKLLGVNMRTTSGQGYAGYDVDLHCFFLPRLSSFQWVTVCLLQKLRFLKTNSVKNVISFNVIRLVRRTIMLFSVQPQTTIFCEGK